MFNAQDSAVKYANMSSPVQAEGWDFEDDIANDDIEVNVNREEAEDAQEEENAELEREHEELEKVLKKEGRVDKQEKDGDEAYKIDLDEDEEEEAMPTVAASRRMEQEREKEGRKHMDKLRKKVKVLQICPDCTVHGQNIR